MEKIKANVIIDGTVRVDNRGDTERAYRIEASLIVRNGAVAGVVDGTAVPLTATDEDGTTRTAWFNMAEGSRISVDFPGGVTAADRAEAMSAIDAFLSESRGLKAVVGFEERSDDAL